MGIFDKLFGKKEEERVKEADISKRKETDMKEESEKKEQVKETELSKRKETVVKDEFGKKEPRESLKESARTSELIAELYALKSKIAPIPQIYPRSGFVTGPGADSDRKLIPAVCQVFDDAVRALQTGLDINDRPITKPQIAAGLKRLLDITRKPEWVGSASLVISIQGLSEFVNYMNEIEEIASKIQVLGAEGDISDKPFGMKEKEADQKEEKYGVSMFVTFDGYINEQLKFTFKHPEGWNVEYGRALFVRPSDAKVVFVSGEVIFSPCITMLVSEITVSTSLRLAKQNPSQLYKELLSDLPKRFEKCKLLWDRPLKLSSGEEALEWSYEFFKGSHHFIAVSVTAVKDNKIFFLDGSCLRSQFENLEQTFCKVIKSLSLH